MSKVMVWFGFLACDWSVGANPAISLVDVQLVASNSEVLGCSVFQCCFLNFFLNTPGAAVMLRNQFRKQTEKRCKNHGFRDRMWSPNNCSKSETSNLYS